MSVLPEKARFFRSREKGGGGAAPRSPGSYAYVFDKRRYPACPASVFQPDQIDLQSSLQMSKKENSKVKSIIPKKL